MILVVDDEAEISDCICTILADANIKSTSTTNAEEVLDLLGNNKAIRCVITDIAMPNMNGIELAERIKAAFPEINIICISGFSEMMLEDFKRVGIDYYLSKPFNSEELVSYAKAACIR